MKKITALLLSALICFNLLGVGALAADTTETDIQPTVVIVDGHGTTPDDAEATVDFRNVNESISSPLNIWKRNGADGTWAYDSLKTLSDGNKLVGRNYLSLKALVTKQGEGNVSVHMTDGSDVIVICLEIHEHTPAANWHQTPTGHSRLCTVCGLEETPEAGHNPVDKHDKTKHWKECDDCGYVTSAKVNHDFEPTGVCECGEVEEGTVPVKFDANGGTLAGDAEQPVKYGGVVTKPSDPTRDGYKFTFWSDTKENGKAYDFATKVYKNTELTLYAQWTEEQTGPSDKPIVPPVADDKGGVDEDKFTDDSGSLTEEDKTTIKGSEISVGTEDKDAANKLATEAAKDPAAVNQAVAALIDKGEAATKENIEFVAKPVLTITVGKIDASNKVVVMDITGMIQVYARIKDKADSKEVPVNGKSQKLSQGVTIVVGLPSIFHNEQHVYVGHKDYQYKAKSAGNGKFSFFNRHGFSDFEFGLQDKAVASNSAYADEFEYLNFAKAAEDAESGQTLTIKKDCSENLKLKDGVKVTLADNAKFTGKINDKDVELSAGSVYTVGGSTTTGGSGGGSSKPSIKPGTTTTPTDPITNPEDQTGTGTVAGFSDVAASAWYADAVKYVVDRGLFGGVGSGRFAPDANMTRAMMWTVLARYKGVDTSTGSNWYEAARTWAMQQNISDGTMADGNVTREQFVTMLWRLSGEPAANNSASFTDNGRVSAYAKTAVDWAVAQGIVNGYNDGSFRPQGSATRAEVAKMLMVFCVTSEG